jgi:hypothetical protein
MNGIGRAGGMRRFNSALATISVRFVMLHPDLDTHACLRRLSSLH